MDNTLNQLNRLKIDCLYGKKKHFNAADRKSKYHRSIGIPLIVLNAISSSVLLYALVSSATSNILKSIPLSLSLVSLLFGGVQTFFNFQKQVEGHRGIGNRYLAIYKQADIILAFYNDKQLDDKTLIDRILELQIEASNINKEAEAFPTSNEDYRLAQDGIQAGEETYTKNELSM